MADKVKMTEVVGVYYVEPKPLYATGLVIELSDGRLLAAQSSDVIASFEEYDFILDKTKELSDK